MSQDYKLKYDMMRENTASNSSEGTEPSTESTIDNSYPSASNTRNLCLCWPDGRRMFLNYAYLVSGEYQPEANMVTLIFTTHTLKLAGEKLDQLFEELIQHLPRILMQIDQRYSTIETDEITIREITVELNS